MPAKWRGLAALVDACVTDSEVALLLDRETLGLLSSQVSQASMLEAIEGAIEGVFECLEDFLIGAGVASGMGRPASVQNVPAVSIKDGSSIT